MRKFGQLVASCALFLTIGCGGNGGNSNHAQFEPGFYRGDLDIFAWQTVPAGYAPLVAEVKSNGEFKAYCDFESTIGAVQNGSDDDLFAISGRAVHGSIEILDQDLDGIVFQFRTQTNVILATGGLSKAQFPTLGAQIGVPPEGAYNGELIVENGGAIQSFGRVTASFDNDGNWFASTPGTGFSIGPALLNGHFESEGSISGATWISFSVGGAIQQTNPRFSFDGESLVVHFDHLPLVPLTAWMTLKRN